MRIKDTHTHMTTVEDVQTRLLVGGAESDCPIQRVSSALTSITQYLPETIVTYFFPLPF
jgi:hypothetical protein